MTTHSSVLAWRIPRTEEPGRRPSLGSHRVGHNWSYAAAAKKREHFLTHFTRTLPWHQSQTKTLQENYSLIQVHVVKAMVFPGVMYGCESWTVKKAERQRIDAFELWCWRRLLRVPWTARRSNQSILTEISPGCSLERMMLKLKLQYFGHVMRRVDSLEKTLMLGGIGGRRRRGRQRMRWLDGITDSMDVSWVNSGS